MAWIGRRSCGLYLDHFPIFFFVTDVRQHSGHVEGVPVRYTLAFGAAGFTSRFVEVPILLRVRARRGGLRSAGSAPPEPEHVAPLASKATSHPPARASASA
jgi:peptidoglycan/LPS O-acetylase OafA/YrhL